MKLFDDFGKLMLALRGLMIGHGPGGEFEEGKCRWIQKHHLVLLYCCLERMPSRDITGDTESSNELQGSVNTFSTNLRRREKFSCTSTCFFLKILPCVGRLGRIPKPSSSLMGGNYDAAPSRGLGKPTRPPSRAHRRAQPRFAVDIN